MGVSAETDNLNISESQMARPPLPIGRYEADCAAGRAHADAVIAAIRSTQNPALMGSHVSELAESSRTYTGVFAGFCGRIAEALL